MRVVLDYGASMAFSGVHSYLSMSGLIRGSEAWSMGLRIASGGVPGDQAAEQEICDDLAAIVSTWWSGQGSIGGGCTLTLVKWNTIGVNGRYRESYTNRTDLEPAVASGAPTSPYPNQVALVATLETGATRGLASRGRMFLPLPTAAVGSDGLLAVASAETARGRVIELLEAVNAYAGVGNVIIASNVGTGAQRPVTAVSVGRVLDTMRSRRTSLEEGRVSAAVAAGT